jgi:acetyltransferase-like isoleucine patch superfamily enzyme
VTAEYREDDVIGPTIEDNVAVGVGAVILPKVTIGKGSLVGAGAIVTRSVEPRTLVMGVPARRMRNLEDE